MTGKPLIDKILLILSAVISLGAAALIVYSHLVIAPPPTNQAQEFQKLKDSAYQLSQTSPVKIKKMVVNLYSRQTRLRYLSIEMDVLPFRAAQKELIREYETLIRDTTISLAGSMSPGELNSLSGKLLLESRIKKAVNGKSNKPFIKSIFFSNFVIQ